MVRVLSPSQAATIMQAQSSARRRRQLTVLFVSGWLVQVLIRLWFARTRTWPAANPDETGYMLAARWLAGGPGADLSGNTFYQGGYPLLLTPAYWLSHDPATVYTLVMVTNAMVGALAFPLAYLALRRLGTGRRAAVTMGWAAPLLPASTFFGAYALTDAVLPVIVLGWVLALDRFVRRGDGWTAAGASLIACYAAAVHTRGTVLVCVHAAALLVVLARRGRRLTALLGAVTTAGGFSAVMTFHGLVQANLYPEGVRDLGNNLEIRLTTLDGQLWAISGAIGQLWYLTVSTWGLAGLGLVALVATLAGRRTGFEERLMAGVVLAATVGVAYISSAALGDEHRVGNFAYGRYLACLALVPTLAGLAFLLRSDLRRQIMAAAGAAAVTAGSGLWVALYAGERLRTHHFIGFDFPETSFLAADRAALHLTTASLSALGLLAGLLALRRLHEFAPAAGLLAISLAAMTFIVGTGMKRVTPDPPVQLPAGGRVAIDRSLAWGVRIILLYPVWWTRLERFDSRTTRPDPEVCTVIVNRPAGTEPAASWPGRPAGWTATAGESWGTHWVTWRAPSCPAEGTLP
ncbi:hypothetical protein ACGFNU_11690 [Spirillospora sp. NPDC048911]|uniref:hypothetical protein n=1 Tax=Spirillospora sp. NPDC048911 TaxID=3364527 RepID=UPI003712947F